MASQQKKSKTKPPRGRPASTSQISQPVVDGVSTPTNLSSFSLKGNLFAFVSLAIDKHRLRVYDTNSGRSVAEHIVEASRVSTLTWSNFDPIHGRSSVEDDPLPPQKKKRKSRDSQMTEPQVDAIEVVLLGLSNGELLFFSPSHARIIRTLSHSSSRSAILCVTVTSRPAAVWTSSADGTIHRWDAKKNTLVGSWKNDDRIPYSAMAVRPESVRDEDDRIYILCANHNIHLLSLPSDSEVDISESQKPRKVASFTGHASSVTSLKWDASQNPSNRFLSIATGDRFISVWEVPDINVGSCKEGKIIASVPFDSDVRDVSLSVPQTSPSLATKKQCLLALSVSGKISIFPVPSEFAQQASSHKAQSKIPTLLALSNIFISSKKKSSPVQVVAATFAEDVGRVQVARIVGGVRPVFEVIEYLDQAGDFIPEVTIVSEDTVIGLNDQTSTVTPNKRYKEPSSLAIQSGVELGQDEAMDDLSSRNLDGDLNVDLAELSLGQRLAALSGPDDTLGRMSTSGSDNESASSPLKQSTKKRQKKLPDMPANSLTRTLIQALHSSDARLLETCLSYSDQNLVSNTVRRLPPQLAVSLINACVERLGRGARGGNMKGRGGGASSQRGTALLGWIKAVLAVHSGHLMTMPDLVARLSSLHATLTTRLALQESLLSLSGRLNMALSQIEMRSSVGPSPIAPHKGQKQSQKKVNKYVEGESEDDDAEQMEVEVEKDSGDDAGSIEDVELGGDSPDEESEDAEKSDEEASEDEEDEDEEDDDDDEDDEGPTMNGFIDDEAEEYSEDEDEDDSD